jgi:branched-chain amino acid transport system permease protein
VFLLGAASLAFCLYPDLGISPLAGHILAVPLASAGTGAIYRCLLGPLVDRPRSRGQLEVDSILATFGLLFIVQGIALVIFGGQYYSYGYLSVPVSILGTTLALNRLLALVFAALIGARLYWGLTHTRTGTAIRAIAVNPTAARLVAVDVRTASAFAFALGGALVAAGGILVSMFLTFSASMGVVFTMKALIVVIVGGVGTVLGALAVGLLLGVIETGVARLLDPGLTLAATYGLFMLALLIRPQGLFGSLVR